MINNIMKTYLLNKYNSLTEQTFADFKLDLTKNMPSFGRKSNLPAWGNDAEGFWVADRDHIILFRNDGSVHTIGSKYNRSYFDTYSAIASTVVGVRTLVPQICDEVVLEAENHSSLQPNGSTIYYLKFAAPSDEFGRPAMFKYLYLRESYNKSTIIDYIDRCTAIFKALKTSGKLFPNETMKFNHFYEDSQGVYLGLCGEFTLPPEQAVPFYLDEILLSGRYSPIVFQENYEELKTYASEKWDPSKI